MSRLAFYRACLLLPLLLPLGVAAALHGLERLGVDVPIVVGFAALLLVGSLLGAGIPYGVCAAVAWWWLRGRSARTVARAALAFPPLFALLFVGYVLAFAPGSEPVSRLAQAAALAGLVLLFGYAYVALWYLLFGLLRRGGWVRQEPSGAGIATSLP